MLPFMWAPGYVPGASGANSKKLIVSGKRELESCFGGPSCHCLLELLPMNVRVADKPKMKTPCYI